MVPARHFLLSIAAGLLAPLPLIGLLTLLQHAPGAASPELGGILFAASFLFVFGVALWRPINPWLYGVALVPGFPLAALVVMAATSTLGNLWPLALAIVLFAGAEVAALAAVCGWFARRWNLPTWAPAPPICAACLLILFGQADMTRKADEETQTVIGFLQQIGDAEKAYAATRPDHAYTCNGPDLPALADIGWRTNYNLGGVDRNELPHGRYWITLHCELAAHSSWEMANAVATYQGGPRFTFDSRTGKVKPQVFPH